MSWTKDADGRWVHGRGRTPGAKRAPGDYTALRAIVAIMRVVLLPLRVLIAPVRWAAASPNSARAIALTVIFAAYVAAWAYALYEVAFLGFPLVDLLVIAFVLHALAGLVLFGFQLARRL